MGKTSVVADIYKPVKDFFAKGYNADTLKLEAEVKGDGLKVLPVITDSNNAITSTLELEQKIPNSPLGEVIATTNISSKGRGTVKADFQKLPGSLSSMDAVAKADLALTGSHGKDSFSLETIFKKDSDNFRAIVTCPNSGDRTLGLALFKACQCKTKVGATVMWNLCKSDLMNWNAALSVPYKQATLAASLDNKGVVKLGALVPGDKKPTFGSEVTIAKDVKIVTGTSFDCDGVAYKLKMDNAGSIGASAKKKVSSDLSVTASAEVSATNMQVSKYGVHLRWD